MTTTANAVQTQYPEVTRAPAGAATQAVQPDHGLRRGLTYLRNLVGDLGNAATAEIDAPINEGRSRVFLVYRLTFSSAHDGWKVTAAGEEVVREYALDGGDSGEGVWILTEEDYSPATLDLGFIGNEELDSDWYDRIADAAEEEWGRGCKVAQAEGFEVGVLSR